MKSDHFQPFRLGNLKRITNVIRRNPRRITIVYLCYRKGLGIVMAEPKEPLVVISFRGPRGLAERIEAVAKRRGCFGGVIKREAIEAYLVLLENGFRLARLDAGAFTDDDDASESGT